ncbi:MAG: terpene cyclase/mutase family protein [Phycisphaeraceae bacterium]|nr:terpene cyclase/mutase family protein [Phycisphaeraceae bacterium]
MNLRIPSLVLVLGLAVSVSPTSLVIASVIDAPASTSAKPLSKEVRALGEQVAKKAAAYLRKQQDKVTGGWAVPEKGPSFPAITALVVSGLLAEPGAKADDDSIARGVAFVLSKQQKDGGIYDQILPSYNTAISLSMLSRVDTPQAKAAIKPAQDFLKGLQFGEGAVKSDAHKESAELVGKDNPFYGGVGYGSKGRPDVSNLAWVLQGLHDSGVPGDDEAFQRALVFLQRTQMIDEYPTHDGFMKINDQEFAKGSKQGGFIYSVGAGKEKAGQGETNGGMIEETLDDGTKVSRLRAYGSMTYAGFKSYLYADLKHDDPRVLAALGWIKDNYTLSENPGIGMNGYYYYLITFSKAMQAYGEPTLTVVAETGRTRTADWREDLIKALAAHQKSDGSFEELDKRWMENNPVLITAYGLNAVGDALK